MHRNPRQGALDDAKAPAREISQALIGVAAGGVLLAAGSPLCGSRKLPARVSRVAEKKCSEELERYEA